MTVSILGADEAAADLTRWADQLAGEVNKATAPLGLQVARTVASRVPVLTGQLAGSVETSTDEEGVEVSMGDGVGYAGWIEFGGTRGRPYFPQGRYLYPSLLEVQDEYAQQAADTAADTVGRFPWTQTQPS